MKKILLGAATFCIAIAACKKGDDGGGGNPVTHSRTDTLTTGKWFLTSASLSGKNPISGNDTTIDLFGTFDSCAKDDRYIFMANGKVTNDQGIAKCDISGPQQTDGGTWNLNAGKDTLVMTDGTLPGKFKIASFSNTNMQLQGDSSISIIKFKITANFGHE